MRNLLAFLAAATLTLVGVGWYLGWYQVQSAPTNSGHQQITIDFDKKKAGADVRVGVEKGLEKTAELRDSLHKAENSGSAASNETLNATTGSSAKP